MTFVAVCLRARPYALLSPSKLSAAVLSSVGQPSRSMSSRIPFDRPRPSPPPLPAADQREFEELVRRAQAPLSQPSSLASAVSETDLIHPDARAPVEPEFEGDINPRTGEQGGPKREPVRQWTEEGDWSFKGRVSDF